MNNNLEKAGDDGVHGDKKETARTSNEEGVNPDRPNHNETANHANNDEQPPESTNNESNAREPSPAKDPNYDGSRQRIPGLSREGLLEGEQDESEAEGLNYYDDSVRADLNHFSGLLPENTSLKTSAGNK
ncbi:hypothetical protein SEMRO_39_G024360.1 [Seminavis robusta]|uniref:Uncharacterized protein n=1 Tax=Seminavis robusta TaxID=568900 RepID=A0A9N8H3I1_9STRA|nr:hypothetical protein SEMRO_39_G024360.1 [Seminavis robusta]|eukprot:Sro39_g024360.1 n/a (130) ;mRNA; r:146516-146905